MKLLSGKRIGQSGYELVLAVFFSFFLHAAVVAAALLLYMTVTPKVYVPPFYEVKLVGAPAEIAPLPQATPSPASMEAPKTEAPPKKTAKKVLAKSKKATVKAAKAAKAAVKKGAIPELEQQKPKAENEEQKQEAAPARAQAPAAQAGKAENVTVSVGSEDQKFLGDYSNRITSRIGLHWNPPPGLKGLKAKVQFTINRSGWIVGNPELVERSGNFYFDQAAVRAIQQTNPFPEMPDDYYKQTATFSVDLVPIE